MAFSQTLQVEHDGHRLTAHYVLNEDGTWRLRDVTSNVRHVPVEMVKELMAAVDKR